MTITSSGEFTGSGDARFINAVEKHQHRGWRIEAQVPDWVIMKKGDKISHGTHLLLCLVTLGFWMAIYGLALIFGGEKIVRISFDTKRRKVTTKRVFKL